ncbi:MAG TPA: FecR domain-containing protein [Burkholderiales bacterium]
MNRTRTSHMLKRSRLWLLALPLLGALAFAPRAHAQAAGSIERVSGDATIVNAANQSRPVRSGESLNAGETVTTQNGAEVMLKMRDDTRVLLRQNTQMKLAEYRYEEKPTDGFAISLLKGALRSVSGLIGKNNRQNVRYSTTTATVGIRGTDFELAVVDSDSGDTRAGTYNYVYDGTTNISIAAGNNTDVKPEQTGLALANPRPGEEPVQLLRERPAFLTGGGFDALIMQLTQPPVQIMPRFR